MKLKLHHTDIEGAPFRIGLLVRVVQVLDDTTSADWIGKCGVVEHYEYNCGCGQTYPWDPMIGVRSGGELEEFWQEELEATREAT